MYAGDFRGQKIVVRDVVKRRDFWTSPAGQETMKVFPDSHAGSYPLLNYLHTDQLIRREAITHSLLEHQNIIPFLGVYHRGVDKPPMIVLPYIEHGSLDKFIVNNPIIGTYFIEIVCLSSQTRH